MFPGHHRRTADEIERIWGEGLFVLDPLVESVENIEQFERLREMGCGIVQGYHLARPGPSGEMERLLAERRGPG